MKKNVLISFVTEADTDLQAVFNLNKVFAKLSESEQKNLMRLKFYLLNKKVFSGLAP